MYERERERKSERARDGAEGEGKVDSVLSMEPDVELISGLPEPKPGVGCLSD